MQYLKIIIKIKIFNFLYKFNKKIDNNLVKKSNISIFFFK